MEALKAFNPRDTLSGTGWTVNISSGGSWINSQQNMAVGSKLRIYVQWPFHLNESVRLQLVCTGKVTRSEPSGFGVQFVTHEFRTRDKGCLAAV